MKNRFRTGLIAALCLCAGLLNAQALRTCSGEADERELVGINEADTCAVPEMFYSVKAFAFLRISGKVRIIADNKTEVWK